MGQYISKEWTEVVTTGSPEAPVVEEGVVEGAVAKRRVLQIDSHSISDDERIETYGETIRNSFERIEVILKCLQVFRRHCVAMQATLPKLGPGIQLPITSQKHAIFHDQLLLGQFLFTIRQFQASGRHV